MERLQPDGVNLGYLKFIIRLHALQPNFVFCYALIFFYKYNISNSSFERKKANTNSKLN